MKIPDTALLLDALLVSTCAGTLVLLAALAAVRARTDWSGHVRHQLLCCALLAFPGVLGLTVALRPGPAGCLATSCAGDADRARRTATASFHHTAAAAAKFSDLALDDAGSSARAARPDGEGFAGDTHRSGPPGAGLVRLAVIALWLAGVGVAAGRIARRRWLARRLVLTARPVTDPDLLRRLARTAGRLGLRRGVRLREHPRIGAPMVTGVFRPTLLLPDGRGWSDGGPRSFRARAERVDMVFLHELAHLRRRDPLATITGEVVAACFWFHPIVRAASKRLRELQELAADSEVLRGGVRPSAYADFLLEAFRELRSLGPTPLSHAHPVVGGCLMETRLRTILDPAALHPRPSRVLGWGIGLGFALLCGALTFAPSALQARGLLTQETRDERAFRSELLDASSLDSLLRPVFIDYMADRYIAGAAISVVHDGRLVYADGFGRSEVYREVPVDAERTIWRIGSVTKVLTGVAVMQLVDRGLLELGADVNDYLEEVRVPETFEEPVRVRHLLTHTAGFDQIGLDRHVARRQEVRPLGAFLAENLARIRPPGEVSAYDTYGITLAGYLVERMSGRPYEEYLKRHIFEPLGMHRSGIEIPPALAEDVAVGYGFAGSWEAMPWEFMNTDPASTVNATVVDMARFALMMLEGGAFDGRRVLSEASAEAMLTRQYANHPEQPGYGFTFWEDRSYGVPAFSHGGSMTGYASFLYLVPEHDLGVFIAYSQESGGLAHAALSTLIPALFPGLPDAPELRPRLAGPIDLSRFTGTYANNVYHHADPETGWRIQPFDIEADAEGRLLFQGEPAFPVGPLSFQREDGLLLSFRENGLGRITHLFVNQAVYERLDEP